MSLSKIMKPCPNCKIKSFSFLCDFCGVNKIEFAEKKQEENEDKVDDERERIHHGAHGNH